MELEIVKDDPKYIGPAKSPLYQPAVALEFFKSVGKTESFAAGKPVFVEDEKSGGMVLEGARMFLLLEGEVTLSLGKKVICAIGKGEIFGEMASILQLPRTATAMARTTCSAISLDAKQFQAAVQKSPEFALMLMNITIGRLRETISTLTSGGRLSEKDRWNRATIFERKVLDDLRRELGDRLLPASHPRGKVVVREGEKGIYMYLVLEGVMAVSIDGKIVEKIGPGGVFGEMALVNEAPRIGTATAETDCSLLTINRNEFIKLVQTKPAFAMSLLKALSERLRFMTSKYR
jgi:CRP-like cAMP-binding protein